MTIAAALQILGLLVPVARADLRRAFVKAGHRCHPKSRKDHVAVDTTAAFREVKEAYEVLLPLMPLTAHVEPDVDQVVAPEPEPAPAPPAPPAPRVYYACKRCGRRVSTRNQAAHAEQCHRGWDEHEARRWASPEESRRWAAR